MLCYIYCTAIIKCQMPLSYKYLAFFLAIIHINKWRYFHTISKEDFRGWKICYTL